MKIRDYILWAICITQFLVILFVPTGIVMAGDGDLTVENLTVTGTADIHELGIDYMGSNLTMAGYNIEQSGHITLLNGKNLRWRNVEDTACRACMLLTPNNDLKIQNDFDGDIIFLTNGASGYPELLNRFYILGGFDEARMIMGKVKVYNLKLGN